MKKILSLTALALIISFLACNKEGSNPNNSASLNTSSPSSASPAAGTDCIGPNPPCKPAAPTITPEEYTAQGFTTAYNMIVSGTVPSEQNQYYQNTLALAIQNGQTDYETGLMAGADAGNIKLKGAWRPPLALISDHMLTGTDVIEFTVKFTLSDNSFIIHTFNR